MRPFCTFIKQIQAQPLVNNALLSLQQRLQLNINVLLFCCWVAERGLKPLNKTELRNILAIISPWHNQIVLALKKLRKHLQQQVSKPTLYKISKLIIAKEKMANQIEQMILSDIMLKPVTNRTPDQRFTDACKNITVYCKELPAGMDQQDTEAIKQLLMSIFPYIDSEQITAYWGRSFHKNKNCNPFLYTQTELDDLI
jgi:uncharacterized protein (TIGR02444 family)